MKKQKRIQYLSEEAVEYMRSIWGFDTSEDVDDMAMFWSHAEYEMVSLRLVEAGAVEPNCKEAKEMIRAARSISRRYQTRVINKCLKDHTVYECPHCNYVHYISSWCEPKDWIERGCQSCGKAKGEK